MAPTCEDEGEEQRKCSCGESETRTVDATGHSFGEWVETKAPTCTEDGEEQRECSCGETETRERDAKGHAFDESGACSNCGKKEDKALDLRSHTDENGVTVSYTDGLVAYSAVYQELIAELKTEVADKDERIRALKEEYYQDIVAVLGQDVLDALERDRFIVEHQYPAIINVLTVYEAYRQSENDTAALICMTQQVEYILSINWNDPAIPDFNGEPITPEREITRCGNIDYIRALFEAAIGK